MAQLADLGGTVLALSPADFTKLVAEDTEKWRKVIRAANIKPDRGKLMSLAGNSVLRARRGS